MEFKCYSDWSQLPRNADNLFSSAAHDSMFFSRVWFETLTMSALQGDERLLLACVVERNAVLAVLPLKQGVNNDWYALGHLYSWLYTLLMDERSSEGVIQCLARGIVDSGCQSLRLEPVAEEDHKILKLQSELEAAGFYCNRQYRFYNWFHPVKEKHIDDYMSARPSRVINTIARKQRKLAREHQFEFCLYSNENISTGLADYNAVYQSSWKAKELFDELVENLVQTFASQNWLRLGVLYIDGEAAAAQLWFVVHGKANIFKLAYDEKWKQYSPGSILIRQMIEYVIDKDGVEEIDFLMGNDAYKQDWMTGRRERWGLFCGRQRKQERISSDLSGFLKRIFQRFM